MSYKFLYAKENDIPTSLVLYYYNYIFIFIFIVQKEEQEDQGDTSGPTCSSRDTMINRNVSFFMPQ